MKHLILFPAALVPSLFFIAFALIYGGMLGEMTDDKVNDLCGKVLFWPGVLLRKFRDSLCE